MRVPRISEGQVPGGTSRYDDMLALVVDRAASQSAGEQPWPERRPSAQNKEASAARESPPAPPFLRCMCYGQVHVYAKSARDTEQ